MEQEIKVGRAVYISKAKEKYLNINTVKELHEGNVCAFIKLRL